MVSINSLTSDEDFKTYQKMIEIGDGLSLNQICNITKLEPYIIQNWIKRGYVPHPVRKKYYLKHLSRILLINALRECMVIEDIGFLMTYLNGNVDDESDDSISEEELYGKFCNIVSSINDLNRIDETINKKVKDEELNICMKVMINAYVAGIITKKSHCYLQEIK